MMSEIKNLPVKRSIFGQSVFQVFRAQNAFCALSALLRFQWDHGDVSFSILRRIDRRVAGSQGLAAGFAAAAAASQPEAALPPSGRGRGRVSNDSDSDSDGGITRGVRLARPGVSTGPGLEVPASRSFIFQACHWPGQSRRCRHWQRPGLDDGESRGVLLRSPESRSRFQASELQVSSWTVGRRRPGPGVTVAAASIRITLARQGPGLCGSPNLRLPAVRASTAAAAAAAAAAAPPPPPA